MYSYSIGKFAPVMEDPNVFLLLTRRNEKRLARFAQQYYKLGNYRLGNTSVIRNAYVRNFLRDSHLPIEIKKRIAVIERLAAPETLTVNYRFEVEIAA